MADIDPALIKNFPRLKEVEAHHTSPEEAGRIFSLARPKLAAFTHIIVVKANAPLDLDPTEVRTRTRKTYSGPLAIGEDLMRFEIDGGEVKVLDAQRKVVSTAQ